MPSKLVHHVLMWLVLAAWIETSLAQSVQVSPGQPLVEALQLEAGNWFFASDGAPIPLQADTRLPAGYQRLMLLRSAPDGQLAAERWVELEVAESAAAPAQLADTPVLVDGSPPRAEFSLLGAVADGADRLLASPSAIVRLRLVDGGGIAQWQVSDSHPQSSADGRWSQGQHRLTALASDKLGNTGESGQMEFTIDAQGPQIQWSIDSPGLTSASGEQVYSPPVELAVAVNDEAGVDSIEVVDDTGSTTISSGQSVALTTDSATIRARDRLGNTSSVLAQWQFDNAGPQITLAAEDGGRTRGSRIQLPVGGAVRVDISDSGSGLQSGRYRYNRKPWQDLPERIRFLHRGTYRVEVEARDRLGNQTVRKFKVRARGRMRRGADGP